MKQAAFTLIELLVVIAIIAVIAGLFLPILNVIQENSRTAQCASNLRQIGGALLLYAGEHNGVMPLSDATIHYAPPASRTGILGWTEQLEPYVGLDRKIYLCPSSYKIVPQNNPYSYFMGCRAAYIANSPPAFGAVRLSLLRVPSKYILAGDICSRAVPYELDDSDKDDFTQNPAFAAPAAFHRGKVNILFADGHVAAYAAFDTHAMTTHYDLKADGTGYDYSDQAP